MRQTLFKLDFKVKEAKSFCADALLRCFDVDEYKHEMNHAMNQVCNVTFKAS